MPGRSVGSTQWESVVPEKIVVMDALESRRRAAVCAPATVAHDRFGCPIGIKDLDSGEQCSWVDRATRSVNNLGSKDVKHRIEEDAVPLSYWPVITGPNEIVINP